MTLPKPSVALADYTGNGTEDPALYAAQRLVFTKQTRLNMSGEQLAKVEEMPWSEIEAELSYMANTIPSSWEFVDYTFIINNVTRAFTHQFVRTRTGSYAQQTMRVLEMEGWTYGVGPTIEESETRTERYKDTMREIAAAYDELIEDGAKIEDARGVLPTNIHTNIVAKFSLRTLSEVARKRASSRTQGEYREVMGLMLAAVIDVHPWARLFLERTFDVAAGELEDKIRRFVPEGSKQIEMIKLIDQMRASA